MAFANHNTLGVCMDKATQDRIRTICTQIGTIMEDASVVALVWDTQSGLSVAARLQLLDNAHADVSRLLKQAANLMN